MRVCLLALASLFTVLSAHAAAPQTFSEAKKVAWKLYAPQSTEFYCGCKYTGNRVDLKACGYIPRKKCQPGRTYRVGAYRPCLADRPSAPMLAKWWT